MSGFDWLVFFCVVFFYVLCVSFSFGLWPAYRPEWFFHATSGVVQGMDISFVGPSKMA